MLNLSAFLRFHARRTPEKAALLYDGRRIAYAELEARAGCAAAWLHAQGIGEGDIVALCMKNSAAFVELIFAVSRLGAILLPVNYRLAAEEVGYIAEHAGARLILADEEFGHLAGLPGLRFLETAAQRDSRVLGQGLPQAPERPRGPDDLFRLMYTSGTTDRPKGVIHRYGNFYWKCMDHVIALGLSAEERLLVVGPLYHAGAFDLPGLAVLWLGGTIHLLREFDPEAVFGAIQAERLTGAWLPPVMLNALLEFGGREGFDLSSLRWCIAGGEKTPDSRIRAFAGLFPEGRFIDAYGLTEGCAADTFMEAGRELEKIGSVGRPVAHVELEIRDEAGATLPPETEGEICLRGPKVTEGYWRDPERTAESFFPGGWFRTGDVGYLDGEGFLYLTDRKKDMIISGGENIASSEVERVIYEHPAVSEAAVIGVPDARWGERPEAVVVLRQGASLDLEALQSHCRAHLAGFKLPKALHLRTSLPRNPSGKVLKRVLREEHGR